MDGIEIKFKCGHCEQEYSQDSLNLAVSLYGIFFLMGKESGYAGITCPSCLKTIAHEGEIRQIESFRETLSDFVSIGHTQSLLDLRYHSSVNYFPQNIKQYKDIGLFNWNTRLSDENLDSLQHNIHRYIEGENLDQNLFCTYAFDNRPPMGSYLSIGWFQKDWIEEFIQIEAEKSVRIFPRYVPYSSLYEDIEEFCWNNQIHLDLFEQSKNQCEADQKLLKKTAEQNNLTYQDILDGTPDMVLPDDIDRWKDQYVKHLKEIEFRTPFDFLSLLVSKPSSYDYIVSNPNFVPITFFWKTPHPFLNEKIPESLSNFDYPQLANPPKGPTHGEMADLVKTHFYKESTQKFLSKQFNRFIFEYIELASKVGYSYAAVWQLKEKYLKFVYDSIISGRKPVMNKVPEAERKEVEAAEKQFPNVKIISDDSKINSLKIEIPKLSKFEGVTVDILLRGESGTGKELFARAIHESSGRAGNFVPVNCASIPKDLFESEFFGHEKGAFTDAKERRIGFFEQADGGTIFLDEIGELDLTHQGRFLRVLENREILPVGGKVKKVDFKIVYATNRDLTQMVADGSFRLDLYQRINEFPFQIPPLRDRICDIPPLINHFIEKYTINLRNNPKLRPFKITDDCLNLLMNYNWEGNVRELKNLIKNIIVKRLIDKDWRDIELSDLPEHFLECIDSEKFGSKPKKGRRKKPSDEELIRLQNDGWTQDQVAEKFKVRRETANRWYGCIRKNQSQQHQLLKN